MFVNENRRDPMRARLRGSVAALLLGSLALAQQKPAQAPSPDAPVKNSPTSASTPSTTPWNARAVEHLYNRAGFGARPSEIEAGVAMGQAALVEKLVSERVDVEPFFWEKIEAPDREVLAKLSQPEKAERVQMARESDRRQLLEYTGWWFERMASGEDPLRERMVLFWHGFFTSSFDEVKRSWLLIRQNELVRREALGSYARLLQGMVRDPGLLTYLDNQVNKKGNPNENFARELMELFSLGVGHYTEDDVKEAARALTGRGVSRQGDYEFHPKQHDPAEKTVLGTTGKIDGEDLVKILLEQPACSRWVAKKLITYFEGVEPTEPRLASYAASLRESEYRLQPFLRRLFLDPEFYRDEVVGSRVQGPVEFMVGLSRRLGTRVSPVVLASGATLLGQRVFFPPSVKGWDEGEAWITTSTLMQRGNLAGFVLGIVKVDDVLSDADMEEAAVASEPPASPETMEEGMNESMKGSGAGDDSMQETKPVADAPKPVANPAPKGARKPGAARAQPEKVPAKLKLGNGAGRDVALQVLRRAEVAGWTTKINFSARMAKAGVRTDAQIADRMLDDLLGIDAPADTRARMREFLAREREALNVQDGKLLDAGAGAEHVLRRLAHLVLSMPEAQLG